MSRNIRHSLLHKSEEQLQVLIGDHGDDSTGMAAQQVLQDKRSQRTLEQLQALSESIGALSAQVSTVKNSVTELDRPSWKSWVFFVAALTLLATIAVPFWIESRASDSNSPKLHERTEQRSALPQSAIDEPDPSLLSPAPQPTFQEAPSGDPPAPAKP